MTALDYLYTLSELTVSRIRYTLIAEETVTLDGDLSPTLRGAIGWAMGEVGCLGECEWTRAASQPEGARDNRHSGARGGKRSGGRNGGRSNGRGEAQTAKRCAVPRCPYARSFLGSGWRERDLRVLPQGYRVVGPVYQEPLTLIAGDEVNFTVTLFGEAARYAPLWTQAVVRAAARGLTRRRARFYLAEAEDAFNGQPLYARGEAYPPESPSAAPLSSLITPFDEIARECEQGLRLKVMTPLLIKGVDGYPPLSVMTRAVVRRAHALYNRFKRRLAHPLSGSQMDWLSEAEVSGEMIRRAQHRYSSSHKGKVPQNGQVGVLLYTQLQSPEWAYLTLALGQELGVGQQTNMGLGRYELETLRAEAHPSRYTEEA